jgi:hypothetical protein
VTALGHGALTALTGPFAPVTAILYTRRELLQRAKVSIWDSVADVALPWLVVAFYAFLLGRLL